MTERKVIKLTTMTVSHEPQRCDGYSSSGSDAWLHRDILDAEEEEIKKRILREGLDNHDGE